jgi:hypothetical protein
MLYGAYAYALSEHQARIVLRAQKGDLVKVSIVHEGRFDLPGTYRAEERL